MSPNDRSSANRSRFWLGVALLLAASGAIFVAAHEGHAPLPTKGATIDLAKGKITLVSDSRDALGVSVVEVAKTPPPESILAYCSLVSPWDAHAFADSLLAGRVTKLNARPGQRVTKGQVLAEVRGPETESISLDWRTAMTTLEMARRVVAILSEAGGAIPETEVLSARNRVNIAINSVELARAKWLALGLPQESLKSQAEAPGIPIRSPLSGTVIHADLNPGKVVDPGDHLFEIVDTSRVWARVGILERDTPRVSPGLKVELGFNALPGETFTGTISAISQSIDRESQLGEAWVELRNQEGAPPKLLPGMKGQARVILPPRKGSISVPSRSLINNGVDRFVLVEEAGTAAISEYKAKSVVVLRESQGIAEVESVGLFPGDRIVARGAHELGALLAPDRLKITPETAKTIGLTMAKVEWKTVGETLELNGEVDHPPNQKGAASLSLAGILTSVHVGPGQPVEEGKLLAQAFSLELISLQLDILREHAAAQLASTQLDQLRMAGDASSRRKLAEAEAAFSNAKETRETLRRKMLLLGFSTEQLEGLLSRRELIPSLAVRAPSAGVVMGFRSTIGRMVKANETLFEIHDYSTPQIRLTVSEGEVAKVRPGQKARARLVSLPDTVLQGTVSRSRDALESTGGSLSAWIEMQGTVPPNLPQGAMARVTLELGGGQRVLAVPRASILREGRSHFVFVQKGSTFQRQMVRLGPVDDLCAGITDGLEEGDMVAATGVEELNTAWLSVR